MFDSYNSDTGVDHELESENVTEPEEEVWLTPSQNMYCESEEETNPPQSKRRFTETSSLPDDSQPLPQAWSQDPLLTYSQYSESEDEFYPIIEKNTALKDSETSFLHSLQSEDTFGIQFDLEGRTSTQKPFKHFHSSRADDEKENSRFLSSKSPKKHSNHKPKSASPRKLWKNADKEENPDSQFKWTKPSSSPLKKPAWQPSCREADEDSLAMLFTQDSEGFRVIAHRGLQARSPLKDQSNIRTVKERVSAYKSLVEEEEEEEEMLFTQDSQGNMVIKH